MADEKRRPNGEEPEEQQEEFAPEGEDTDSLPPLSDFESDASEGGDQDFSGLPPISDIPLETPVPTGGNVRPAPSGYSNIAPEDAEEDLKDQGEPEEPAGATGFQDLSADSDFSPETPAAGGDEEEDFESPLFGSDFDADQGEEAPAETTSAPTQAMETPMFGGTNAPGGGGQQSAFDADAFGGGGGQQGQQGGGSAFDFDDSGSGTPAPDFSTDSGGTTPPPAAPAGPPPPEDRGMGWGAVIGAAIIALIIGIIASAWIVDAVWPTMPMNPLVGQINELQDENDNLERQIASLNRQLERVQEMGPGVEISPEEAERLQSQIQELQQERNQIAQQMEEAREERNLLEAEVEQTNSELLQAQQALDTLENRHAIVQARTEGLRAEASRLENEVASLSEADQRRRQSTDALESALNRLAINIREGLPLTPPKYSREERIQAVQRLQERVDSANWVTPELLNAYTDLYLQELDIANSREYFFAKIPVEDRYGTEEMMWAECLMNGNWSVYYRTINGRHVGVYENTAASGSPQYDFVENLPKQAKEAIEATITAERPSNWNQQLQRLAQKQGVADDRSRAQRIFESL